MFKWVKTIIVKQAKKYLSDDFLDEQVAKINKKIDLPDMNEEQELEHFNRLKVLIKELIVHYLDSWAKK